ncbi:NAD-binding protein [Microcoleus sp. FACHB-68]|nr:NAD-binding protein [Microcoleus sp. FACHB-68]
MYLIIVGAGPEGSRLVELALKDGHRVSIIEKDEKRAQAVPNLKPTVW